ncbi:MAG: peptide ABC transporter substrate-binding protein [Anaerolineae bacterium]|nr:peptide ABC transporter substrate-binding protein [Anaerolineae bacterium]
MMKAHRFVLSCFVLVASLLAAGFLLHASARSAVTAYDPPPGLATSSEVRPLAATTLQPSPHPILGDVSVRRAIATCTDKDALVAAAYPDLGLTPAEREALTSDSFIAETSKFYTEPATTYGYDPSAGVDLLEAAGWMLPTGEEIRTKNGQRLVLMLTSNDSPLRVAYLSEFEAQMRVCGIDVIRDHSPDAYTTIFWRDFELSEFAWVQGDVDEPGGQELYACDQVPSPDNGWSGLNTMGWCNQAASDAIELAGDTTLSDTERLAHYETFIDLFSEDVPSLPLFWRPDPDTHEPTGAWEHLDFNLETYLQQVDATPAGNAVLTYTHYWEYPYGTVAVPPGAVTQTTAIGFYPLVESLHPPKEDFVSFLSSHTFRLTAFLEGVPQDTFTFEVPITVTLHYFWTGLPEWNARYDKTSLVLLAWDGTDWQDAYLTCPEGSRYVQHDLAANTYVVRVCRVAEFSVMGQERPKVFLPLVLR